MAVYDSAGVFRIEIEAARQHRIVRKVSAEFIVAFNRHAARFQQLGDNFRENRRFGEVF